MANKNLTNAKKAKNDEFYTQMSDIEKELQHYKAHFAGKTVFCNCDDPTWSNFWRYFHLKFSDLKLKKLIATHYDAVQPTYKIEYEGGNDNDYEVGTITPLMQNGDFRSPECVELLKEADIVVTNPPFSLFREYVAQLIEYGKKFVIIGSMNAITYKEIFPLIKNDQLWLGNGFQAGNAYFRIKPEDARNYATGVYNPKTGLVKFRNCVWFTNLDIAKRHEPLDLVFKYDPERYPRYDNYDAINVDKTVEIPCDYVPCWFECPYSVNCHYAQSEGKEDGAFCETHCNGEMGVPISYLDKHCPEQFEIVGNGGSYVGEGSVAAELYVGGEPNRTEPNRTEPNRTEPNNQAEGLQANYYSQVTVNVMESSECQSASLTNIARNSSELLKVATDMQFLTGGDVTKTLSESIRMETILMEKQHTSAFTFNKCNGVMGVPISFLDRYSPEQFAIIGADGFDEYFPVTRTYTKKSKVVDGKRMKSQTGTMGCVIRKESFEKGTYFDVGYPVIATYKRIFIKRKQ